MTSGGTTRTSETPRLEPGLTRSPSRTDTTQAASLPETLSYRVKRVLLGPPLVSEQLGGQRLGKPTALAVLSSDVMSSSAYATEQMLRTLILVGGLAAFSLITPLTAAILGRAGGGDDLLPRRRPLVSQSGRLLRRQPGQLRAQRGPDRRSRAPHQLHHHRGGVGGGRGRCHRLGRARPQARRGAHCRSPSSSSSPSATSGASARRGASSPSPPTSSSPTWRS